MIATFTSCTSVVPSGAYTMPSIIGEPLGIIVIATSIVLSPVTVKLGVIQTA